MRQRKIHARFQQGMTLIMLVFIVVLAATAFMLHALNANTVKIEREKKTAAALAEAKAALIGWSARHTAMPGALPCPEDLLAIGFSTEGQEVPAVGACPYTIGRLPWRSLGLGDLRDGYGERLWYVVSAGFHQAPLNSTSVAQLSVDGVAASAVAIVFSPGPILPGQTRPIPTSASPPDVAQYLDLSNNDGDAAFVSTGAVDTFNDKLIMIRAADLFSVVANRVLGEIRGDSTQGLKKYYADNGSSFPFADTDNDSHQNAPQLSGNLPYGDITFVSAGAMLTNNNWLPLVGYTVAAGQQSATLTLSGKTLAVTP